MKKLFLLAPLVVASFAFANDDHTILKATSVSERKLTLDFPTNKITTENKEAVFCSDPVSAVTSVKLWMPAHGHGSTPTKLTVQDDECVKVQKINFSMVGNWEIRVVYEDGDKATFKVNIEQ